MYESGNEDKINENDSTIESINDNIKQKELEDLQRENQTLKQMVENRNQELKKETPEEKIQTLATVLGISKINERLDELNKNDNYLVAEMSKIVVSINQIGQNISGNQAIPTGEAPPIGDPLQKMELLSNLFDKGIQLYTTYKQNSNLSQPQLSLFNQDEINERMKKSATGTWDLGEAIIDTLTQKVVKKAMSKVMSDIAIDSDEPV